MISVRGSNRHTLTFKIDLVPFSFAGVLTASPRFGSLPKLACKFMDVKLREDTLSSLSTNESSLDVTDTPHYNALMYNDATTLSLSLSLSVKKRSS